MNTLRQALNEYLALRQAMGFKLQEESRLLPRFIDFLDAHGETFITTDMAVRWATQCRTTQPAEWARRLRYVRIFARYRSATDPRTQIPPTGLLPYRARRAEPYIYNDDEINRLLQAAGQLCSPTGLRAHTYVTALGLLAVTGMRISELVALDNDDVDLAYGQLTIHDAKFGKSRWLPLHSSTQQALQRYVQRRDQQYPIPCSSGFFVSEQGTRLTSCTVRATFVQLSRQIGLRGPTDSHGPRLHDFRHRFAVQTLLR
ncbi:MAG TPA: tyrosine-type recombinase/integrase [Gammaproteobacteria bacterium]|nr:tyrosine-type recombinase/integrase [Gammaproteobacteria bacterium]